MEGGYTCLPHLYQGKAEMLKTIMEFSYQGPKGNKLLLLFNISKTLEILKVTMQCINYPYGIFMTFYEQLPNNQHNFYC